nr:helix-turn-helix domain-containing protein [Anaerolineae bacterium]NIQ80762.1 helix-turn-helix domain-containing protein [Anaerolineae bacterium]
ERRRRRAIALLEAGHCQAEVARRVDAHSSSVKRWWEAYQKNGEGGLAAKPVPGRPSKLTARQRKLLVARLLKGAKANGFSTDLWTCPRIAKVIEDRYGVHYHVDHIPRLMASLGFSAQKPEKQAVERDEERIARWVAKDWTRIKKSRT